MDAHKSVTGVSFQVVCAGAGPHTKGDGREALRDESPWETPLSKEREATCGATPLRGADAAPASRPRSEGGKRDERDERDERDKGSPSQVRDLREGA